MEKLSKIVKTKSDFADFDSFFDYYKSQWREDGLLGNREMFDVEDLDFLEGIGLLVRDNPKVIKFKEIVESKLLKVMKGHFVKNDEDLTKSNVRRYLNGYRKMMRKSSVLPMYYFITDEDYDNFLKEGYENDVVELLIPIRIDSENGSYRGHHCCIDTVHDIISDFTKEMLSSDIKTITRKLLPINL
tara:strand:+ start:405 stop:965 length:561 start_codon:yes stop_codon:yes gene_type:complete